MRAFAGACVLFAFTACGAGERTAPPVAVAPAVTAEPPSPIALPEATRAPRAEVRFESWKGLGVRGCSYLAPKSPFVRDGAVDLVFHFHAGQMSDREIRASGLPAVFVSCGFGMGTTPYARAFSDPRRFDRMVRAVLGKVGASRVERLALVAWSAGFASVAKILSVRRNYEMIDTVVLLDGLHCSYDADGRVDPKKLGVFVRFAADAARGEKTMVVTHSSIVPPGYASTTEATRALLDAIDVPVEQTANTDVGRENMTLKTRSDAANLHVRGFRGTGVHDHLDHLHLVGQVLRSWVVPRW